MNKPTTKVTPTNQLADYLENLALANKATLLSKAQEFTRLHAPHVMWKKTMKHGASTVLVRREWPGVLAVYDPTTGELLVKS